MKKLVTITIPATVQFADLKLARDPDGHVSFDAHIMEQVYIANGLDPVLMHDEDNVAGLIAAWYGRHLELGGERDPVEDDLILETMAEDALGDGLSHAPGRA